MTRRALWCLTLFAVALAIGCQSEGHNEITIEAFGMTFRVVDKTYPNSEGKDRHERGFSPEGLAILQSMIAERRDQGDGANQLQGGGGPTP